MNVVWIIAVAAVAGPLSPASAQTTALSPAQAAALGPAQGSALGPAQAAALGPARTAALTCAVTTPSSRPLTFAPNVGLTPRSVAARGNLQLTGCTSPDGSAAFLRSGWASVKATAQASCTSARHVRGSAVITWFGVTGRPVGTSKLRIRADRLVAHHPADTLLTGSVAAGWLVGERVSGGITPTSAILGCATRGMGTLVGDGHIAFG